MLSRHLLHSYVYLLWMMAIICPPSPSFAEDCIKAHEKKALDIRALQSELMVSALTCDMRMHYNDFIKDYSDTLPIADHDLKRYFFRQYGKKDGLKKLDSYITEQAGKASLNSLSRSTIDYCAEASDLYYTLSKKENYLEDIASGYNQELKADICTDRTQAILNWLYSDMQL